MSSLSDTQGAATVPRSSAASSLSSSSDVDSEDATDERILAIRRLQLPPRPVGASPQTAEACDTADKPTVLSGPSPSPPVLASSSGGVHRTLSFTADVASSPTSPKLEKVTDDAAVSSPLLSHSDVGARVPSTVPQPPEELGASPPRGSTVLPVPLVAVASTGPSPEKSASTVAPSHAVSLPPSENLEDDGTQVGASRKLHLPERGSLLSLSKYSSVVAADSHQVPLDRTASSEADLAAAPPCTDVTQPVPAQSTLTPDGESPLPRLVASAVNSAGFDAQLAQLRQQYRPSTSVDFFVDPSDPATASKTLPVLPEKRAFGIPDGCSTALPLPLGLPPLPQSATQSSPAAAKDAVDAGPANGQREQVTTLRRKHNPWEALKGLSLFADSSGGDSPNVDFSDGIFSTGSGSDGVPLDGSGEPQVLRHVGERRRRPDGARQGDGSTAEDGSPNALAPRNEEEEKARRRRRERIAKQEAKRTIFKTLETTATSGSSGSQQGVSVSSTSAGEPTPEKNGTRRTGTRGTRRSGARRHGDNSDDSLEEDAPGSVRQDGTDGAAFPTAPPTVGLGADENSIGQYRPTLRGPVSFLRALYDGDERALHCRLPAAAAAAQGHLTWRPPIASHPAEEPQDSQGPWREPSRGSPSKSSRRSSPFTHSLAPASTDATDKPSPFVFDTVLSVTIRGMSPLHADIGVVHPFVRVWLLHCITGENLIDAGAALPCAITHPYDLRSHGSRSPWWEAEVAVCLKKKDMERHQHAAVLLFEVLDCGNEAIHGVYLPRNGLYPICWGYLMLHDCVGQPGVLFMDNVHVQLYRFPMRTRWYMQWLECMLPPVWSSTGVYAPTEYYLDEVGIVAEEDVAGDGEKESAELLGEQTPVNAGETFPPPSVFLIFKSPLYRTLVYGGGLVVTVKAPHGESYIPRPTTMLPYEEYLLNLLVMGGGSCAAPRRDSSAEDDYADWQSAPSDALAADRGGSGRTKAMWRSMSIVNQRALGQEYARKLGERALLPLTALQTTPVHGCVSRMEFFHRSPILAIAVVRNLQYIVELRNTMQPDMPVLAQMYGHTGHIHDIAVRRDDQFVTSASSDKTVRVWRVADLSQTILATLEGGEVPPNTAQLVVEPVCVLPHGFPIYSCIFHQDTIVTAGYSAQLQVWRYDRLLSDHERFSIGGRAGNLSDGDAAFDEEREHPSLCAESQSSLRLTATFTPGLDVSDTNVHSRPSVSRASGGGTFACTDVSVPNQQLGELICTSSITNEGSFLSVASNENSNRIWSVSSSGVVFCWRALYEVRRALGSNEEGKKESVWQMSVRSKNDCDGASKVDVRGTYAVVTCRRSPVVYVYDATSCESIRVINTHQPPSTPLQLLPDGLALVAGTKDGNLVAWECSDGGLCTPAQGDYTRVRTKFPVVDMAWADTQQLAALQSPAPCPASCLPTYGVAPEIMPTTAQPNGAVDNADVPTEVTLIAIVGTSRSAAKPITASDTDAADDFCVFCGGDLGPKRRAAQLAARKLALKRQQAEHESRKTRLYDNYKSASRMAPVGGSLALGVLSPTGVLDHGANVGAADDFLGTTTAQLTPGMDYTENGLKINSILGFWRGLVHQHRHTTTSTQAPEGSTERPESPPGNRTDNDRAVSAPPLARRAQQYSRLTNEDSLDE